MCGIPKRSTVRGGMYFFLGEAVQRYVLFMLKFE